MPGSVPVTSHVSPSKDTATVVESDATATNLPLPNVTSLQAAEAGKVEIVQVTPLVEYAADVDPVAIATNLAVSVLSKVDPSLNVPYATSLQLAVLGNAVALFVHDVPFWLVAVWREPLCTATKVPPMPYPS